ncbi:MAG: NAD(P)H-hydrate epimerase, partial [Thermodesulfobacteriota bacterium]|nr:NAD(P)H-hydrate epimerase [Thermodesulfobacteriota bacterium]
MKVVTAELMQQLDRRAIEEAGIPGIVLMENAGRGIASEMLQSYPEILTGKVAIVAGRGNNGGDGFVIARYLFNRGVSVNLFLVAAREQVKGDAKVNLDIATKMKIPLTEITTPETWKEQSRGLEGYSLIVDALFGTGLKSEVTGLIREIIADLNCLNVPTVAVDLPSGLQANTGEVLGICVQAELTVTCGLPKWGLVTYPGATYTGRLKVVDIAIPSSFLEEEMISDAVITVDDLRTSFKERDPNAHKGDYGHVLVIGGSSGKTGAAALSCQAAARTGAGLVTLGIPASLNDIMEEKLTEVMTEPLDEQEPGFLGSKSLTRIQKLMEGKAVVALGPGIGTREETFELVHALLKEISIPLVVDADGINALSSNPDLLKGMTAPLVLTPHPGEMARLVGSTSKEIQNDRITVARTFAQQYGCYLVLKGAR